MRLLIVTQVVDKDHAILGFFHRWIEEFSKYCESVQVICLQEGSHTFPSNVTVYSLGKESGRSKLGYVSHFFKLIWSLRSEYDNVFVHMNQIYVILGASVWFVLKKPIGLWYAHGSVTNSLKLAVSLSDFVFTSTQEGLRVETQKRVIVGQGIDTSIFKPISKMESSTLKLVTVGRISQSKNIDTLLHACATLKKEGVVFTFCIVGKAITAKEEEYEKSMRTLARDLGIAEAVTWTGAISNHNLPKTLQESDIFIHDGSTNSLDKVLLEAVLCGCIVVSSNPAYASLVKDSIPESVYEQGDYKKLASIVMTGDYKIWNTAKLQRYCRENFTVGNLIKNITSKYN